VEEEVEFIEGTEEERKLVYVTKEETMEAIARYFRTMSQPMPKTGVTQTMKNFRDSLEKVCPGIKNLQPHENRKKIDGIKRTVILGIKFRNSNSDF